MKILIDMNCSPSWAGFFSCHDIEAVHWSQIGSVSAPDSEIAAYAAANGYALLTHDLDFGAMLAETGLKNPVLSRFVPPTFTRKRPPFLLFVYFGDTRMKLSAALSLPSMKPKAVFAFFPSIDKEFVALRA
ncbi:MAG: DUF5615 family PIN-like protein [Spirochaetaceae bacterium]|jgi:hypothetical protein|nr:DUF5615 family PIN-like protein [Spirochaetaceae bacterium]